MKSIIILFIISTMQIPAQISQVKQFGDLLRIYDETASFTGKSIHLSKDMELLGYNSEYIIIRKGDWIRVYDHLAQTTGDLIHLRDKREFLNVTQTNILIKEDPHVIFFDFDGKILQIR